MPSGLATPWPPSLPAASGMASEPTSSPAQPFARYKDVLVPRRFSSNSLPSFSPLTLHLPAPPHPVVPRAAPSSTYSLRPTPQQDLPKRLGCPASGQDRLYPLLWKAYRLIYALQWWRWMARPEMGILSTGGYALHLRYRGNATNIIASHQYHPRVISMIPHNSHTYDSSLQLWVFSESIPGRYQRFKSPIESYVQLSDVYSYLS